MAVSDVLIDSGAAWNVMGQQTWGMLKLKERNCESRKSARELLAHGGTVSLPTLGIFITNETLIGRADFLVV